MLTTSDPIGSDPMSMMSGPIRSDPSPTATTGIGLDPFRQPGGIDGSRSRPCHRREARGESRGLPASLRGFRSPWRLIASRDPHGRGARCPVPGGASPRERSSPARGRSPRLGPRRARRIPRRPIPALDLPPPRGVSIPARRPARARQRSRSTSHTAACGIRSIAAASRRAGGRRRANGDGCGCNHREGG